MSHIPETDDVTLPHSHRRTDDPATSLEEQATAAGLTEDQLAFFTEQTRRAVHKALRAYRLPAFGGYLALLIGLVIAFSANADTASDSQRAQAESRVAIVDSGRAVAVDGCNRDFRTTDKFRGLLIRLKVANTAAYANAKVKDSQTYKAAQDFYDSELQQQIYPNCGAARSIITDNPNVPIVVPRALSTDNPSDAQNDNVPAAEQRIRSGKG